MQQKHLLIRKAYVYEVPRQEPKLEGYSFDTINGYWVDKTDNSLPYVFDVKRPKPQSKKADVETGEDQKGE